MDMIIRAVIVAGFLGLGYGAIHMTKTISEMKENIESILEEE